MLPRIRWKRRGSAGKPAPMPGSWTSSSRETESPSSCTTRRSFAPPMSRLDTQVMRARACGFRVLDFDWCEIRTLDAGSWFLEAASRAARRRHHSIATSPIRIPTLAEALRLTADLNWLVNVEIKSFPESPPGLVEAVLNAIEQTGTADRVLLSSFDHRRPDTRCRIAPTFLSRPRLRAPRRADGHPACSAASIRPRACRRKPIMSRPNAWGPIRSSIAADPRPRHCAEERLTGSSRTGSRSSSTRSTTAPGAGSPSTWPSWESTVCSATTRQESCPCSDRPSAT